MGAGGMEYGVALYERPGALERIARSTDHRTAAREDALAVTLDDEPHFAIKAVRDAYGLKRLPIPIKMVRGRATAIDTQEVAILGGVLRLLAGVSPTHRNAGGNNRG